MWPMPSMQHLLAIFVTSLSFTTLNAQPPVHSEECLNASKQCEANTDCIHRLAVLQSACVTNTCQPQCREAAMNLYQNREGRQLLRTDASCVPGKYELEKCGFLPNKSPKHCSFAKLICETDLQCNAKWEVFISECESETSQGECSVKCRKHLNATLETQAGASLETCTCTDKEDNRCIQLRDTTLRACATADIPNKTIVKTTTDYVPVEPLQHPHTPAASDPFGHGGANPDSEESNPDSASTAWLCPLSLLSSLLLLAFAKFGLFA